MIPNKLKSINKNQQESSFSLPAHGWVGARATLLFPAAHFALQNTNSVGVQSEGEAEGGGVGGITLRPSRSEAPPPCSFRTEPSKKVFFSFYEEKIGRAQIKKCEENFFAGWRASASGGGAERQFRSKKFRAKFRISHQSQLLSFWGMFASGQRPSAFGLCALRKAIKSHGGKKEKEMDLSFSYLK
jgi:hypothetical protein